MGEKSGKPGPDPGCGGRPRKPLDEEVMKRAASIGCNNDEIAALLGFTRPGFDCRLEREPDLALACETARNTGRATLRRLQWQQASAGNPTMLIWLGKNMLSQTDRTEVAGPGGGAILIQIVKHTEDDDAGAK